MRVAVVTETFLPKMDGIVRMLVELLGYLRRQGHEALIIAPGQGPDEHDGFAVRRVRGLRWRVYPGLTLASPAPRQLGAALREWRPDIVHLAGPVLLGAQATLVARSLGLPLAAHFQTDLANYTAAHGVPYLRRAAWSYLRTIHRLADRTYCPTPSVRRQLQAEGFRDLALCGRGVDTAQFHPARRSAAFRARVLGRDADPDTPVLAYVGRVSPEKNLDALVAVARARPTLPLLIVGDGPARPWLQRALAGHRAYFTGELRGDDLAIAYASADINLCTSLTETFCQVAQEAMASGLPVVGFRAGGVQDVIAHGEAGLLCPPGEEAPWLGAIDRLANDRPLRRAHAARARAIAEGRTWDVVFDRLLGEYDEIAHVRAVGSGFRVPGSGFFGPRSKSGTRNPELGTRN
jgi:phosphatidylinositol alpha 1,6-mannosyltransferase